MPFAPKIKLNNGLEMPLLGLGTYLVSKITSKLLMIIKNHRINEFTKFRVPSMMAIIRQRLQ